MRSQKVAPEVGTFDNAAHRTGSNYRIQEQDGHSRSAVDLFPALTGRRVSARVDQTTLWAEAVSLPKSPKDIDGSYVGVPQLQRDSVVQLKKENQDGRAARSACLTARDSW